MYRRGALLILLFALALPGVAAADGQAETEVTYLLQFVAASGCTFVRNGDSHHSAEAADHLRMKYKRGRRYADTAEQFIDRLASNSSWSGKPYTVTCAGKTEASSAWLHRALEAYRQAG